MGDYSVHQEDCPTWNVLQDDSMPLTGDKQRLFHEGE